MRYCVERNLLTDESGKVVPIENPNRFAYHSIGADSVDDAIENIAQDEGGDLLHPVYRMGQQQAMATVKRGRTVMTLHAFPESEAAERLHGREKAWHGSAK